MSLIMDALRRAQQLRLKDREAPPFPDAPTPLGSGRTAPRKRKVGLLIGALLSLTAILLGWVLLSPSTLFRHERGKEALPSSPVEKPQNPGSSEKESPKPPSPTLPRPEGKGKVPLAKGTEERKTSPTPRNVPGSSEKHKRLATKETLPERSPKVTSPEKADVSDLHPATLLAPRGPSISVSVDPHGLFNQALRLQNRGEVAKAIEAYSKVVEIDPQYHEAYNNLGLLYQDQGESRKAEEAFKKAIGICPNYVKALNNLGILFYREERYDEAMDCFERALLASPNHVESHLHKGLVLKKKGQFEKALEAFEWALRLNPLHGETHYNVALLLEEFQRIDEAIEHYQRFVQISWRDHPELAEKVERHLRALRTLKKEGHGTYAKGAL